MRTCVFLFHFSVCSETLWTVLCSPYACSSRNFKANFELVRANTIRIDHFTPKDTFSYSAPQNLKVNLVNEDPHGNLWMLLGRDFAEFTSEQEKLLWPGLQRTCNTELSDWRYFSTHWLHFLGTLATWEGDVFHDHSPPQQGGLQLLWRHATELVA